MTSRPWVFFYGSYMNREVLAEVGLRLDELEIARVAGWELVIRPRANLLRVEDAVAWGVLTRLSHDELARLYTHARDVLGVTYQPEAVLAETRAGTVRAALCYVAPEMEPAATDPAYVDRIIDAACEHGLPAGYVARLEALRPAPR